MVSHKTKRKDFVIVLLCRFLETFEFLTFSKSACNKYSRLQRSIVQKQQLFKGLLEKSQHAQKVVVFDKARIFAGGALGDMRNNISLCQLFSRTKKTIDLMLCNQINRVQQRLLLKKGTPGSKAFIN